MIYQKPIFEFGSVFAPHIRDYINLRESLSTKFRVQSGILRQFDRYCISQEIKTAILTEELAGNWIASKHCAKHATLAARISYLRGFADYLASVGCQVLWSPRPGYAGCNDRYVPYIYSEDEIRCIFDVADNLPKPRGHSMFHLVFSTMIKVLYCCGLRVSEVLALHVKHVDLYEGFIFIERSKFENSRRLPVSQSLLEVLRNYAAANCGLIGFDGDSFFFPNADGEQYSQRTVYDKFRTVLWRSGIPHQGQGKGPRVHDLRHTFAVRSLQQNIRAGKDIYVSLPVLMSYLGHSKISSTEYYLRLTAEMFPDFLARANTICAPAIPEVTVYDD